VDATLRKCLSLTSLATLGSGSVGFTKRLEGLVDRAQFCSERLDIPI
jgi:hypothetical protein